MSMIKNIFLLFVLIITATGCASGIGKLEVDSLNQVEKDEIIIVGKIKLDPVLNDIEQELNTRAPFPLNLFDNVKTLHKNKISISINKEPIDITHDDAMWEQHVTTVNLEKTFFIRIKRSGMLYYSGGIVKTAINENLNNKLFFPGGVKYKIKSSDRAIYVGTIEYYRDFNEVEKVQLLNEYSQAKKEFENKFGNNIRLRKVQVLNNKDKVIMKDSLTTKNI